VEKYQNINFWTRQFILITLQLGLQAGIVNKSGENLINWSYCTVYLEKKVEFLQISWCSEDVVKDREKDDEEKDRKSKK